MCVRVCVHACVQQMLARVIAHIMDHQVWYKYQCFNGGGGGGGFYFACEDFWGNVQLFIPHCTFLILYF